MTSDIGGTRDARAPALPMVGESKLKRGGIANPTVAILEPTPAPSGSGSCGGWKWLRREVGHLADRIRLMRAASQFLEWLRHLDHSEANRATPRLISGPAGSAPAS
jgi:hypothetical protein